MKPESKLINKRVDYYYSIISSMLVIDLNVQENSDFSNIKDYLKTLNLDVLKSLREYINTTDSPCCYNPIVGDHDITYINDGTTENPEELAKRKNFLIVLVDCEINDQEKEEFYNQMYEAIINLDLTKVEEYLDTIDVNKLLVLNYYLTWHKLNHKDTNKVKDELISSLIETNVRVRLGNTFLSAD